MVIGRLTKKADGVNWFVVGTIIIIVFLLIMLIVSGNAKDQGINLIEKVKNLFK